MSKKRYFNITLNGEPFILDKAQAGIKVARGSYSDIYDAYERPSRYKIGIWNEWKRWFIEHDGYCFISSKNCMQFTISGYVYDENGDCYECYITKAYNRCWKVVEA